jgi:hypothetical protein
LFDLEVKGTVSRFSTLGYFHQSIPLGPLINGLNHLVANISEFLHANVSAFEAAVKATV